MSPNLHNESILDISEDDRLQMSDLLEAAFIASPLMDQFGVYRFWRERIDPLFFPEDHASDDFSDTEDSTQLSSGCKVMGIVAQRQQLPQIHDLEDDLNPILDEILNKIGKEEIGERLQRFLGWTILTPRIKVTTLPRSKNLDSQFVGNQAKIFVFPGSEIALEVDEALY